MKSNYYFSAKNNIFYFEGQLNIPEDVVAVSDEIFITYTATAPEGKARGADKNGLPCWVDEVINISDEALMELYKLTRNNLITEATEQINILSDAVEFGEASEEDQQLLIEWRKYRVAVNKIKIEGASPIDWPQKPE